MAVRIPIAVRREVPTGGIVIGAGALASLGELLARRFPGRRVAVLADATALDLHCDRLCPALPRSSPILRVPSGERHKTRAEKVRVEDELLSRQLGRDTVLVGFGGGVLTDLAGFVAATYLRGVPFVAIPTTLLGAVDASVGGKTGVNTRHGKNLIGVIRQPAEVLIDPSLMETLPEAEFRNGVAEALKMAATSDPVLFAELEADCGPTLAREPAALARLIERSVRTKARVVAADEREAGEREVLNFGHTIGHGLERATGYRLSHGQAVAIGVVAETQAAVAAGCLPPEEAARVRRLFAAARLPGRAPADAARGDVLAALPGDKKARRGHPRFVVLEGVGRVRTDPMGGGARGWAHKLPAHAIAAGLDAIGLR